MSTFAERAFALLARARTDNGGHLGKEQWIKIVDTLFESERALAPKTRTRRTPCTPPSPEEVTAYSISIEYPLDGEKWCDSYEAKGWVIGRNIPMKNWRCAVRNWKHNKWTIGDVAKKESSVAASLGALQIQLRAIEEELTSLLYPGGAAFKTVPTGEKLERANFLASQRKKLKDRIEAA